MDEGPDDPIEREWRRLCDEWDDDKSHKRFLALCASLDRLADASARYRAVRETNPDEDRRREAAAQTDRILQLAMQRMELTRTRLPGPRKNRKVLLIALTVAGAIAGSALYMMTMMMLRSR